ncbi:hypothetical protein [Agromyces larvae]|uniref:Uncharacterized protein n=1 Tax=Agromyces larvae TaxID=2929802 RepID=A0ABY4C509_9MICO|nr:hypothetical protein [Agromyces larvae]UOE45512.1 hypothetical protein MTO99_07070 [Agromyces larvae]
MGRHVAPSPLAPLERAYEPTHVCELLACGKRAAGIVVCQNCRWTVFCCNACWVQGFVRWPHGPVRLSCGAVGHPFGLFRFEPFRDW